MTLLTSLTGGETNPRGKRGEAQGGGPEGRPRGEDLEEGRGDTSVG